VLLVVRLNDTALYDYLQRVFAGLPDVKVDQGTTGGRSPSGAIPRRRRAPTDENAADSARRGFLGRLQHCAIHAESDYLIRPEL